MVDKPKRALVSCKPSILIQAPLLHRQEEDHATLHRSAFELLRYRSSRERMYVCILDAAGEIRVHCNAESNPEAFLEVVAPYRDRRDEPSG